MKRWTGVAEPWLQSIPEPCQEPGLPSWAPPSINLDVQTWVGSGGTAFLMPMLKGTWTFKSALQHQSPQHNPFKVLLRRTAPKFSDWALELGQTCLWACAGVGQRWVLSSQTLGGSGFVCDVPPLTPCPGTTHTFRYHAHSLKPCLKMDHFKREFQLLC